MGCFNSSCYFSGLPITYRDSAVIFPVVNMGNKLVTTLFPIYGEYNDYGSLQNIVETPLTNNLVELFKKYGSSSNEIQSEDEIKSSAVEDRIKELFISLSNSDNCDDKDESIFQEIQNLLKTRTKYKFKPFIKYGKDFNRAFNDKHKDVQGIKDIVNLLERQGCDFFDAVSAKVSNEMRPIEFVMVHSEVWKAIKHSILSDDEYRIDAKSFSEYVKASGKALSYGAIDATGYELLEAKRTLIKNFKDFEFYDKLHEQYIPTHYADSEPFAYIFEDEVWGDGVNPETQEVSEDVMSALEDLYVFRSAFFSLRRNFVKSDLKGSQYNNYKHVKAVCEAALKVCNEEMTSDESECEE